MEILEAMEVSKDYTMGKTHVQALKGLNLTIHSGEMVCIMGPSGSGKSTLLNLLGLLDTPSSGQILLQGKATQNLPYKESAQMRSRFLGFIFQSFNLFPVLNAFENIEYPLLFHPLTRKERRDRVWGALSDVQLREVALHRPDELSGGQRQRVAIARALVTHPLLILADEPTANLDSESAENIMTVMQRLNQSRKTTFVFSTHDPRVVHHASRIVKITDGVIQHEGTQATVTNILEKRLSQ
ncbi:MAG: ABC transporter ATP-binding protein [Deltaproteobacteria bacterium]|nr:ABC transporter ATP-binding protein [Deltaproteobacteria bacterium]